MMAAGMHVKQRYVQHVRYPGQRMPVAGMGGCECPDNIFQIDPALDPDIFGNIQSIIEANKLMPSHLLIGAICRQQQKQTDKQFPADFGRSNAVPFNSRRSEGIRKGLSGISH